MKIKVLFIAIALCVSTLSGCENNLSGSSSLSSYSNIEPDQTSQPTSMAPPVVLPILDFPMRTTPNELNTELSLEYSIYDVPNAFLSSLSQLRQNEFTKLLDVENFFELDGFVLYYTTNSATGPSCIWLELPNGKIQELFTCSQPIMSLTFWDNKTLAVELADFVHFEGYSGNIYLLSLESEDIQTKEVFATNRTLSSFQKLYRQTLYTFTESERSTNLGEAYDVYRVNEQGKSEKILTYAPFAHINSNRIYYINPSNRNELLSTDLYGKNIKSEYDFEKRTDIIKVYNGKLIFGNDDGNYVVNLVDKNMSPLNVTEKVVFGNDGLFCLNRYGVLEFVSYDGVRLVVMSGIDENAVFNIVNKNLYLRVYKERQFYYFKTDMNASKAVLLNP